MPAWDPIDDGRKLAIFIGCICIFSTMTGLGIWGMNLSRTIVQTDPEGLTKRIGSKSERVHWDDIVAARAGNSDGTYWKLVCRDGRTIKLELSFIEDQETLKAMLQTKRLALPTPPVDSFRMENRWLLGLILAAVGVALLAGANASALGSFGQIRPPDAIMLRWVGVTIGPLCLISALALATTCCRVRGDSLIRTSCFGTKTIRMPLVNEIVLSNSSGSSRRSPIEYMRLHYDGRTQLLSSNFADFAILRDQLLSLAPQAKIVDRRTMKV